MGNIEYILSHMNFDNPPSFDVRFHRVLMEFRLRELWPSKCLAGATTPTRIQALRVEYQWRKFESVSHINCNIFAKFRGQIPPGCVWNSASVVGCWQAPKFAGLTALRDTGTRAHDGQKVGKGWNFHTRKKGADYMNA